MTRRLVSPLRLSDTPQEMNQSITKAFTGHVRGVAVPSFDDSIDDVLDQVRSPWGGGGNCMRVAVCGLDGETIYRVEEVDGMGEWMGLVLGLERLGLVDLTKDRNHPSFDAIFAPSPELLANATALLPAPPCITDDLALAAGEIEGSDETEREQLILARQGQGRFRSALLRTFGGRCALTGFDFEPALRASHIKPWRECSNQERLDSENGLLLRADVDALFDGGHISFTNAGSLILSSGLPESVAESVGLRQGMPLCDAAMTPDRVDLLAFHRNKIYRS